MSKDELRYWVAAVILTMWFVAVLVHHPVAKGLAAAVGIILTWLFIRNGKGGEK